MSQKLMLSKNHKISTLMIGVAFLFVVSSLALPMARADSQASYPLQSSLSWNFVQSHDAGSSYFNMNLTLTGNNAPQHVALTYSLYYIPQGSNANWTDVQNHGASLNFNTRQTSQSVSFTIPYKGAGEYLFVSTFENNAGQLVSQSIVDPKIEPEF
jgi:hypothetical protein